MADNLPPPCADVKKSGGLNLLEHCGPLQACNVTDLSFTVLRRNGRIVQSFKNRCSFGYGGKTFIKDFQFLSFLKGLRAFEVDPRLFDSTPAANKLHQYKPDWFNYLRDLYLSSSVGILFLWWGFPLFSVRTIAPT
jgi:UDP-glucose 6-dehydrogenase